MGAASSSTRRSHASHPSSSDRDVATRLETFAPELVVVGGGMGGISCAMRARRLGARVALIEPEALGGT
jgi:glycerol-3-phosphate dehydrogenase